MSSEEPKLNPTISEYEVLSEDRRVAIDIFLKGVVLAAAFLGVIFKFLVDSKSKQEIFLSGFGGLVLLMFFHYVIWKCLTYETQLTSNLKKLEVELLLKPVISLRFIFNIVWLFALIVSLGWISILIWKLLTYVPPI